MVVDENICCQEEVKAIEWKIHNKEVWLVRRYAIAPQEAPSPCLALFPTFSHVFAAMMFLFLLSHPNHGNKLFFFFGDFQQETAMLLILHVLLVIFAMIEYL